MQSIDKMLGKNCLRIIRVSPCFMYFWSICYLHARVFLLFLFSFFFFFTICIEMSPPSSSFFLRQYFSWPSLCPSSSPLSVCLSLSPFVSIGFKGGRQYICLLGTAHLVYASCLTQRDRKDLPSIRETISHEQRVLLLANIVRSKSFGDLFAFSECLWLFIRNYTFILVRLSKKYKH